MIRNRYTPTPMSHESTNPPTHFELDADILSDAWASLERFVRHSFSAETQDPVLPAIDGRQARDLFQEPLPRTGCSLPKLIDQCGDDWVEQCRRNGHSRFFGYVCASADPVGVFADAMTSALNQNVTAWRSAPSATELERLVLGWLDEMVGFGGGGHGLLVSGGSAANFTALACAALTAQHDRQVPRDRMTVYITSQGHLSLPKAARVLGIEEDRVRRVRTDNQRRMDPAELDRQIQADLQADLAPMCVCASAGTVNTGAIDPLSEVASICGRHGVWYHIDGAYGAPAAMTREYGWMSESFRRADSMSLDPHKWLFSPFDVGCVLFRDADKTRRAFSLQTAYVEVTGDDEIERFAFFDHGLELSRRFRALKVWMIIKVRGVDVLASVIERNIVQRRHLDERIKLEARLESLGSGLSVSCFRYVPEGNSDTDGIDALNQDILQTLNAEGRLFMSPTVLDGQYCLRVCIVNFRTSEDDIDFLVNQVLRVGDRLASSS